MLDMKQNDMVTIEILQKSQRSRPRKWIPVLSFIFLLITLVGGGYYAAFVFPDLSISQSIIAPLPTTPINLGGIDFTWPQAMLLFFVPYGLLVWDFVCSIICGKICNYRKIYWIYGWIFVVALIGMIGLTTFVSLYYLVPASGQWLANVIPADIIVLIVNIHVYVVLGETAALALFFLFCLFYNLNYPAKYEAIYELRKRRLKSFALYDERLAYKKRFYNDYKYGRWISMMLDLHFESLDKNAVGPMRKDAYDFMVYYGCLCDNNIKRAVFDSYAAEGRYYECRSLFHDLKEKSQATENGAKVIIPHYDPAKHRKKKIKTEQPKRVEPPLKPYTGRRNPDARVKTWSPEDI